MSTNPASNPIPDRSTRDLIQDVLRAESAAIERIAGRLDERVEQAVDLLLQCRGRTIVTGMGKMGYIARKAAATFCSTGTPAVFLHPGEAAHGDLGMVSRGDVLLALSKSGETAEVNAILPYMHRFDIPVISLTGCPASELASRSQIAIDVSVPSEADTIELAPTSSSTVALAMCDALAVALMQRRGFTREQFALFHPGGNLGRRLLATVEHFMHAGQDLPTVARQDPLRKVIVTMSQKRLGAALVIGEDKELLGLLTDGDLRRTFERCPAPLDESVADWMTVQPQTIGTESLAVDAIKLMEAKKITSLPVVDPQGQLIGLVHLHDLIRAGLA
ncbi:MAG: KpsF/GutQ family sugar-phosphate isomerase [Mariniblastus sp.]|nr:KpsF/GutQ family sugar-phosphate isomerase [Mariniblastus sp.]